MKNLFFVLLLLFCSFAYSQTSDDSNTDYDFKGFGTEPFWTIKIDLEKGMFFDVAGDELKIETGIPNVTFSDNKTHTIYSAESDIFNIKVRVTKESCVDGMSDNKYPYSVKISITRKGYKEIREFSGCGNYNFNPVINDIWALAVFKDKNIKDIKGLQTRPYLEIHTNENKIYGNASCNEFYGTAEVIGNKIFFGSQITLTKMNCSEMNLEMDFIQALSGKIYKYKIEKLKLYLINDDNVIMEFNKMD